MPQSHGPGLTDLLDLAPPPREVPRALRWRLLLNGGVLFGSVFFGGGMIFTVALAPKTGLWSTLQLYAGHQEAPGRVDKVRKTGLSENQTTVYRYDYSFNLPEGVRLGTSYSPGKRFDPGPPAVTIEYLPGNPDVSRIQGTRTGLCPPFVLFVLIFPTIGLAVTLGGLLVGWGRIRLLSHGELARATITSCRQLESDAKGNRGGMSFSGGGMSFSIPMPEPAASEANPDDPLAEIPPDERRRDARRKAFQFWLRGVAGLAILVIWNLIQQGGLVLRGFLGWFLAIVFVGITAFSVLTYFIYRSFGGLIQRRARLAKGASVEDFQKLQAAEQKDIERLTGRLAPVGAGCGLIVILFLSLWLALVAAFAVGFVAMLLINQQGLQNNPNGIWIVLVAAGCAFVIVVVPIFLLLQRWQRRKAQVQRKFVPQTTVECQYEFALPGGEVASGTDRFPPPSGPDDLAGQLVLYDPGKPQHSLRLIGISPPPRISEEGLWETDLSAWSCFRLVLVCVCYTVGPLLGWLLAPSLQ